MEVNVTTNLQKISGDLKAVAANQIPFATAKALTNLAWHLKKQETSKIPRYFETRTKRYKSSLRVTRAEKRDYPNAYSMVSVRDEILALGATGGERPNLGAVPGTKARSLLNPARKTLGPRYFPAKLLQRSSKGKRRRSRGPGKPFLMKFKSGKQGIVQRQGPTRKPIDILYVFEKNRAKIKKRWPLVENVSEGARRLYQPFFVRSLYASIKSSKTLG